MRQTRKISTIMAWCAAACCGLIAAQNVAAQEQTALSLWGQRAPMLQANSEFALADAGGLLYVLGGYPQSRQSVPSVQIYDTVAGTWRMGPPLPQVNNHGMAAAVNGTIYLIGGQTDTNTAYVNTVYALAPGAVQWVQKAPMPTARSSGVAVVLDGKIYVAGGRPPRGNDFAVYDPVSDTWETLPNLPSQRNHIAGAALGGKIYVAGGRLQGGFQSASTAAFEVYDPATRRWSVAAPMLSARSGINGVVAYGCFHVWGGEGASGMHPQHEVYDPRTDRWTRLPDMPIPVHGVTGAAFVGGLIWVTGGGTAVGGSSGTLLNQTYRPEMRCEG